MRSFKDDTVTTGSLLESVNPQTAFEKCRFCEKNWVSIANPSVCCSLHGCRSKTKAAHRELQQQLHDNVSRYEQTRNDQPSSCVTRDDEGHFLITNNFCLQGLEQTAAVPYRVPKTPARQNASNFRAVTGLKRFDGCLGQ